MRITASIAAAGIAILAGSAQASSPIPANYVDDFGPVATSASTDRADVTAVGHASPIASNYVDDFGSTAPIDAVAAKRDVAVAHASPIPSNYIDDFGPSESREPGGTVEVAEGFRTASIPGP